VAVVGLPDPVTGERCCAVVVAVDPDDPPAQTEVAAICRTAGLSPQKTPEQVECVDELPRNASGKVLKYQLQARYTDEAARKQ
jgi:non-ribosomal peptide synthetase component E (peptide arylation enzyme)